MKNLQNELSTLERLLAPTPTYFRAIQITAIVGLLVSIPVYQLIPQLQRLEVILPAWFVLLGHPATLAVEITLILISQLTVDRNALSAKRILENIQTRK